MPIRHLCSAAPAREEESLRPTARWARKARSLAILALGSSAVGVLLAASALLTG